MATIQPASADFPWHDRLAEARALIGTIVASEPHVSLLTAENIRHFAIASGDDNPIWLDPAYARAAGYSTVLAPPTMILAHNRGQASAEIDTTKGQAVPVMPDMLKIGSRWEITWQRRIRLGDRLHSETKVAGADLKQRHAGGHLIAVYGETRFWDEHDVPLAAIRGTSIRLPKAPERGGMRYEARHHAYSEKEMEAIEADILAERRRGAAPIAIDPPAPGAAIMPVVKGPITEVDLAYWYGAYNPPIFGGLPLELRVRGRDAGFGQAWGDQMAAKSDSEGAARVGFPNRWFSGPGVITWFAHLMTNWMGDAGFLKKLDVRVSRPAVLGDTVWCKGEVLDVAANGAARVRLSAINQLGEQVAIGEATTEWTLERE